MDLVTILALLVAGVSILVDLVALGSFFKGVAGGLVFVLPLTAIAFPEELEAIFRRSRRAFTHGGEGPVPGGIIRVGGWVLLIAIVILKHYLEWLAWTG